MLLILIEILTKMPLAAKVAKIQDHEASCTRELVT
jgi:hypothetical protein